MRHNPAGLVLRSYIASRDSNLELGNSSAATIDPEQGTHAPGFLREKPETRNLLRSRSIFVLLLAALFACLQPLAVAQEAAEHLCCIPQQEAAASAGHCHEMDAMQSPAPTVQFTAPMKHHQCCDQMASGPVTAHTAASQLFLPAASARAIASTLDQREFSRAVALIGRGPPARS